MSTITHESITPITTSPITTTATRTEASPVDMPSAPLFPVGTRVEVRRRFDQHWAKGFEVAEHDDDLYRLKRLSDGEVLPVAFEESVLRKERKKSNWWY